MGQEMPVAGKRFKWEEGLITDYTDDRGYDPRAGYSEPCEGSKQRHESVHSRGSFARLRMTVVGVISPSVESVVKSQGRFSEKAD
jgi:hypothetical protein